MKKRPGLAHILKKIGHSLPLSLYFLLFNAVDSIQNLAITRFEPRISRVVKDRSTY